MEKLNEEQLEAFKEVIDNLNENDLELVEAYVLDKHATDKLDAINVFVFRNFNSLMTEHNLIDRLSCFEDEEFAHFKVTTIEDVFIIYAYI